MKKRYIIFLILAVTSFSVLITNAQTEGYISIPTGKRIVEINGVLVDAAGKYDTTQLRLTYDAIYRAIRDDVPNRTAGDGTVYVLKRNHVYIQTNMIDFQTIPDIHIRGEEGAGRMPLILHDNPNGGNGNNFIRSYQNTIFENFEWDGQAADGPIANRAMDFRGANTRVIVKGCRFVNDRAGSLTIEATGNGIKLYVYDCLLGNSGHYISQGGNGRALDIRINAANGPLDTVIFKNCTMYNLTDRVIRNMNASIVNYMELDHNTVLNSQGYHGCMQFGNTRKGVVTNNIFANALTFGNRFATLPGNTNSIRGEQQQADKAFAIVTHNGKNQSSTLDIIGVTMRNNNIFFEQEFLDVFAANPTIFETPNVRAASDAVRQYLVEGTEAEMSFTEKLAFDYNDGDHLGSVSSYKDMVEVTKAFVAKSTTSEFPENWSRIYPYEWNAVYPTSSRSYSAADKGYPLGDLNWFPSDKAKWLTGVTKAPPMDGSSNIGINQAYPNPFPIELTVNYSLPSDQSIEIGIYNAMGQKVRIIKCGYLKQGTYNVTWDGKGNNGDVQPGGIYFIQITGSSGHADTKVIKK